MADHATHAIEYFCSVLMRSPASVPKVNKSRYAAHLFSLITSLLFLTTLHDSKRAARSCHHFGGKICFAFPTSNDLSFVTATGIIQ